MQQTYRISHKAFKPMRLKIVWVECNTQHTAQLLHDNTHISSRENGSLPLSTELAGHNGNLLRPCPYKVIPNQKRSLKTKPITPATTGKYLGQYTQHWVVTHVAIRPVLNLKVSHQNARSCSVLWYRYKMSLYKLRGQNSVHSDAMARCVVCSTLWDALTTYRNYNGPLLEL